MITDKIMNNMENTDGRNIVPKFWGWTLEQIKSNLDIYRHNFSVLFHNVQGDFNISTGIRNCNAFLAKEIFIYGKKQYNKSGTVGTHWYENIKHVKITDNLDEIFKQFEKIVSIENVENSKSLEEYNWDYSKKTLMIFGEEEKGIDQSILNISNDILFIRQYGSVRSINVGVASGIAMFSYCKGIKSK